MSNIKKEMRSKILLFVVMSLFLISLTSAQPPFVQDNQFTEGYQIKIQEIGTLKQDAEFTFNFKVFNISNGVPIDNSSTGCDLRLEGVRGQTIFLGDVPHITSNVINEWAITLNQNNFTDTGNYAYTIQCNSTTLGGFESVGFEVTPNGLELTTSRAIVLLLLMVGLSIVFFYLLNKFFNNNEDYGWHIGFGLMAYLTAFIIAFVSYVISYNYIYDIPIIADVLNRLWIVMAVLSPILLIIVAFSLLKEQSKELTTQRKQKYGYSREEASR